MRRRPQPGRLLARGSARPSHRRKRSKTARSEPKASGVGFLRSKTARSEGKAEGRAASRRRAESNSRASGVGFLRSKTARSEGKAEGRATSARWKAAQRAAGERSRKSRRAESNSRASDVNPAGGVVLSAAILATLGIVMIYSTTAPLAMGRAVPPHLLRHLLAVAAGGVCVAVALRVPLTVWRRLALPLWGISVALLLATLLFGVEVNGARRWIAAPGAPLRFQPAELAKWATLLAVAAVLARRGASLAGTRAALALAVPPAALLLAQPDFGSAAMLIALCAVLLFVVGTPLRRLLALAAAAVGGAGAYIALRPYAAARWTGFLDPWQTAHHEGFQLVQSFIAFARGGTFGVGLGDGRQKLFYLPEAHTDFMLSVVAEELGLVGVLVVLGAFAALVVAGTRIALRAREPFVLLVAFGMTASLALPAVVNAAVVMGLLPTTGFPLPFVSYGGNALLFSALAVGVLLRIAASEAKHRPPRFRVAVPGGLLRS